MNARAARFDRLTTSARARSIERGACRRPCALAIVALIVASAACGGAGLFRQYEYEEDVYLSLDGSATVYVNASVAALNALRGTSFDPKARADTAAIRAYYTSAVTRVGRVSQSRRNNRRFVHVRVDVDDIRRLSEAPPFAWSTYQFTQDGNLYVYRQTVDGAAGKDVGDVGWTGRELVAFRLHLPSKIRYNNTHGAVHRGNILVWEQRLTDRLRGAPLTEDPGGVLDARMDAQSILYRTLWLFGVTFLAVAAAFAVLIWWIMRKRN